MQFNSYIDHTLLKATATSAEIAKLCEEADQHSFFSVCVNGSYVGLAHSLLKDSNTKVCCVVGFPLGAMSTKVKIFEAQTAIEEGADEIDMVINIGWLKSGQHAAVFDEIRAIKEAIGTNVLKVILETGYLSEKEIGEAASLAVRAKADFVKTSTGFGPRGASFEDVRIMKEAIDGSAQIKASGGIRDAEAAKKYIEMGVTRLGTSSGIALVKGQATKEDY
ncbi:deoxyribose-phosphate aldolase [Sungkyunkwania multivorans]|uniref:Deoxyribose-phosphate aldolase n=1 Tax=Sungkyunkwania multivorans TaxID=1173618 RepID=A0ABW3CXD5_9FLAO